MSEERVRALLLRVVRAERLAVRLPAKDGPPGREVELAALPLGVEEGGAALGVLVVHGARHDRARVRGVCA